MVITQFYPTSRELWGSGERQNGSGFEKTTHFVQYVNNSYGTKQSCEWYFTEKRIMASFISMIQPLSCGQVWSLYSFSEAQMKTANLHHGRQAQHIRTCQVSIKSYARFQGNQALLEIDVRTLIQHSCQVWRPSRAKDKADTLPTMTNPTCSPFVP